MYIATTAFAPTDNDFSKGGLSFKVGLVCVGYMRKAKRVGRKTVYNNDGTYTYSREVVTNIGDDIFEPLEITGLKEGSGSARKFLLMKWWDNEHFSKLEELQKEVSRLTGKKTIVRYQWDNTGPHMEKNLKTYLENEFEK